MRKENSERPGVWTAAAMPQNPLLAPPPPPNGGGGSSGAKLEICIDDEFQDDDPEPSLRQLTAVAGGDPFSQPRADGS